MGPIGASGNGFVPSPPLVQALSEISSMAARRGRVAIAVIIEHVGTGTFRLPPVFAVRSDMRRTRILPLAVLGALAACAADAPSRSTPAKAERSAAPVLPHLFAEKTPVTDGAQLQ